MQGAVLLLLILFPVIGAFAGYAAGTWNERNRDRFVVFCTAVELIAGIAALVGLNAGITFICNIPRVCGLGIYLKMDGFRAVFVIVAAFLWLIASAAAIEHLHHSPNRNRYHLFSLITLSAVIGVFLSADFFTMYIFFEIMTFASFVLVIHNEKPDSIRAAKIYISFGIIGGMAMLLGIGMLKSAMGTVEFEALFQMSRRMTDKSGLFLPGSLIFFGFAVKAGIFPVHTTLPEAYPAAPAPAAALLSGILSKTGIWGIIIVSVYIFYHEAAWGKLSLILGAATMLAGAFIAVFSTDIKKILAGSSVSQIGFILFGLGLVNLSGEQNALAIRGSLLHMVNHSLIKLVLFLTAGVICMHAGGQNLNRIRGFGKGKPVLHLIFLLSGLGVAGVPLFNGYISKTLLHESLAEYIHSMAEMGQNAAWLNFSEILFVFTGGMTLAYMLKLYVAIFWEENEDPGRQKNFRRLNGLYIGKKGAVLLLMPALLMPVLGSFTQIMNGIADLGQGFMFGETLKHAVNYYSLGNLQAAMQTIMVGTAVYFLFIRLFLMEREAGISRYADRWPERLSLNDRLYIPFALLAMSFVETLAGKGLPAMSRKTAAMLEKSVSLIQTWTAKVFSIQHILLLYGNMTVANKSGSREKPEIVMDGRTEAKAEMQAWKRLGGGISYSFLLFGIGIIGIMLYLLNIV